MMADLAPHSLVLASDYRVSDIERMWSSLRAREAELAGIGAHHVIVYAAAWESGRVLVTIGVRNAEPVPDMLRSPAVFAWFDVAGIEDIPAVFVGEVVERFDLAPAASGAGVMVAAITSVDDLEALLGSLRAAEDRSRAAGVCQIRVYRALDNEREVLILQEFGDELSARRWLDRPGPAAAWLAGTGRGPYPPVFVGRFSHMMTIDPEHTT